MSMLSENLIYAKYPIKNKIRLLFLIIAICLSASVFSQSIEQNKPDTLKVSNSLDSLSFREYNLEEVSIVKPLLFVIHKFDRKVFPISENKKATARTIVDLLRALPGVVVDENGRIRFKGADAFIYIDEQPMERMYSSIEMIPVEQVDKIELIDPAMRTGGDGLGGIINIQLKTEKTDGLSGMASVNAGTVYFEKVDNSRVFFNLNYKKGKTIFFLNSSIENTDQYLETDIANNIRFPDFSSNQTSISQDFLKRTGFYNYLGVTHNYSKDTKLYLSFHFLKSMFNDNSTNNFSEYNENNEFVINRYIENTYSKDNHLQPGFYISYWHKIDTLDSYFKLSSSFYIYNIFYNNNLRYNFQNIDFQPTDSFYRYDNERNLYFYFNRLK